MKKNIWILVVALIVFACYELFLWKNKHKNVIKAVGEVEFLEITVNNAVPGKIDKIYVTEGDLVKKGQLLGCLSTEELESKHKELLEEGKELQGKTSAAISELLKCQESLNIKDSLLEASEYLFENKCISKEELDDVRKRQYISLDKYSEAWKNRYDTESDLSAACNKADQVLQDIMNSKVYSDFEGKVEKVSYKAKDLVEEGSTLLNIVNKTNLIMITHLKEKDVKKIKLGNKARINFDDIPGEEFNAKVIFISSKSNQAKEYPVKLEIEHRYEHPVRIGMKGVVFIDDNQN